MSQVQLLQPFVTIGASAMLLGEVIDGNTLLTAAAVFAVIAFGKAMPIAEKPMSQAWGSRNQRGR